MQRTQCSDVLVIIPTHVTAGVHPLPSVTSPCLWLMGGPGTCVGPVTTGLPDRQDASLSPPGSPISTVVGPERREQSSRVAPLRTWGFQPLQWAGTSAASLCTRERLKQPEGGGGAQIVTDRKSLAYVKLLIHASCAPRM